MLKEIIIDDLVFYRMKSSNTISVDKIEII